MRITWEQIRVSMGLFGKTVRIVGSNGGQPVRTRVIARLLERAFKKRLLVQAMGYSGPVSLGKISSVYFYLEFDCTVSAEGVNIGCCQIPWTTVDRFIMSMGWRMEY